MDVGFFSAQEIDKVNRTAEKKNVPNMPYCGKCKLFKGECTHPKMKPTGGGRKKILIIGEAPGEKEDEYGRQFIGPAGKVLKKALADIGISLHKDCRKVNAVNCRPPKNRTPTSLEIECCRPIIWNEIKKNKPKVIIVTGISAFKAIAGMHWNNDSIGRARGFVIPDREHKAWICPTFHPSYILRLKDEFKRDDFIEAVFFKKDLQQAKNHLDVDFPNWPENEEDQIEPILDPRDTVKYLKKIILDKPQVVGIDFETTALNPFSGTHRIVTCAIATDELSATSFFVKKSSRPLLIKILKDRRIGKIAHNIQFEEIWSRVVFGQEISSWIWDSMVAAHILDNRGRIASLKVQAYLNFGIPFYNELVESYLKGTSPKNKLSGTHKRNNIFALVKENPVALLKYNGMDAMLCKRLAMVQAERLGIMNLVHYFEQHKQERWDEWLKL